LRKILPVIKNHLYLPYKQKNIIYMARIDELRKQHPELNVSFLDIIVSLDPTSTYKYTDFIIKSVKKEVNFDEVKKELASHFLTQRESECLKMFEKHAKAKRLEKSDISQYKSFDDLDTAVKKADEAVKLKGLEKEVSKLYETEDWVVLTPLSYEASKTYGANTKWCVTQESHYKSYQNSHRIFYILSKKSNEKYAVSRGYGNSKDIQAWLADDTETSPMMLPLPFDVMGKIIEEVRKTKEELSLSLITKDTILVDGVSKLISEASLSELKSFENKYDLHKFPSIAKTIENVNSEIKERNSSGKW